ncbi:hypothetical protein HK105_208413 [Polyrhizophydium stewartii]|uniref:Uncharacterized protein n=1 Tax=Polyrhizophydium stewartii TaxID=2732419 RepID=A0ABR4MXY0_9FUNG
MCIRAKAGPPPALDPPVLLHEQAAPFVREYRHIGAIIDDKLSFKPWLEHKRDVAKKIVGALTSVLANHRFSPNMRLRVFDGIVLGNVRCGIELFCDNKADIAMVQPAINAGLRTVFGVRPSAAVGPLLVESGIGSLAAISFAATMCLFNRACEKRTPIKLICHNPQVHNPCLTRKWCLSHCVRQQRRKYHAVRRLDLPVSSRDDLRKFVLARTLATSSRNDSTDRYPAAGFIQTAGFVHDPMFDQLRSRGVRLVAALRMNGLCTVRSALRIPGLLVNHPFAADGCIQCDGGITDVRPLAHLVLVCVSLRAARRQAGLDPLIDMPKEQDPQANDDAILTRLLGGASQGEAAPGQTWLGGDRTKHGFGTFTRSENSGQLSTTR